MRRDAEHLLLARPPWVLQGNVGSHGGICMLGSESRAPARPNFILYSLVWLPAGIVVTAAFRGTGLPAEPQAWLTLVIIAPCGLPLALACRRLRLRGYPAVAWVAFAALAPATIVSSLFAGLLGPVAIALYAAVISMPVWIAAKWLVQRRLVRWR